MLELHVWGLEGEISIIDPESLACAWLLSIHLVPQLINFKIVTSSNTNLSHSGRLPLLLERQDRIRRFEGFSAISDHISTNYASDNTKFVRDEKLSAREQLINLSLISYVDSTIRYINQYNLYVNTQNYELYTRKLFLKYLPFPMMYNQPLKFHNTACEQVKLIGLGVNKIGMFSIHGGEVAETETINEDEEDELVAISALHEKQIIAKQKSKNALKETRNSLKCLHLLNTYVAKVELLFKELNPDSPVEFAHLFRSKKISSSELLLYAYFCCLTYSELPDTFILKYLEDKFPAFWKFASTIIEALNSGVVKEKFRAPAGVEVPSLWNEIGYTVGAFLY
ncbi:CIC11C00000005820 [Sungouiella intermedia]|uniref:CIC11C00000005820 n=1 Tax=Sungouiella intermedia TaxID=45354 RepID=A0A1L0C2N8_9ASCO|nr:CIC11C00000005820 [[Candida] intermedia]